MSKIQKAITIINNQRKSTKFQPHKLMQIPAQWAYRARSSIGCDWSKEHCSDVTKGGRLNFFLKKSMTKDQA